MTSKTARRSPTIAVLGLGKAGGSLLSSARAANIDVLAAAARFAGLRRTLRWRQADVLFLAVPDDALPELVRELALSAREQRSRTLPRLIAHLSGAQGASALAALAPFASIGTFHPLAALDGDSASAARTFVAVDARPRSAQRTLSSLARRMGLLPGFVAEEDRVRYHAGAVVAGNLATALLYAGVQLLTRSGVPEIVARESLARLLSSTAHNAIAHRLPQALTGPVARGDRDTIARHCALLAAENAPLLSSYRALSLLLIDEVSRHDQATKRKLRKALG